MGIAIMPWKLLANYKTFILGWLGGYAAFLGPVAGIMICDYWVIRGNECCGWTTFICATEFMSIRTGSTGRRRSLLGAGSWRGAHRIGRAAFARALRLFLVCGFRCFVCRLLFRLMKVSKAARVGRCEAS